MKSISCPLQQHARGKLDKSPAIVSKNKIISYQELEQLVSQAVIFLKNKGIKRSTRVVIVEQTSIESVILFFTLIRLGAVVCFLNPRLPQSKIANQSKQIKGVRISSSFIKKLKKGELNVVQPIVYNLNQKATVVFTSGSTGRPKAAVHTIGNHYYSAQASNQHIPLKAGHFWLLSLPLYHVGGISILWRTILAGAAITIPDYPRILVKTVQKSCITHISLVPTQLLRLLEDRMCVNHLKKFKAILLGGAAIPENLVRESLKLKLPIYKTYGLTEMSSQVATTSKITSLKQANAAKVLKHALVKINRYGEIYVKGKTLFKGYIREGRVYCPVDQQGWFKTGDLGVWRKKGELNILGRVDHMFISGGENIYPEEIECELNKFKEVARSLVVACVDREFGQRPVCFIDLKKNISIQSINRRLKNVLPSFKIPDKYFNWPKDKKGQLKVIRSDFIGIKGRELKS